MKKSELKMMIREIVREEVALTMKEVIKEIIGGSDKQQIKPKSKPKINVPCAFLPYFRGYFLRILFITCIFTLCFSPASINGLL